MNTRSIHLKNTPAWLAVLFVSVMLVFSVCGWAQVIPGCCPDSESQPGAEKVAQALPPCCLQQQTALVQPDASAGLGLHDLPSLLPEQLDLRTLLDGLQSQRNLASVTTALLADQSNRYLDLRRLLN